jgi:vacuolar iron transporter family protein
MSEYRDPITHTELHDFTSNNGKLNWLRAAVLGANDGIVSVASILLGVAGATSSTAVILTSGIAGLVAGALSMAMGEYVSVSTQTDTEKALLEKEEIELETMPEAELEELTKIYQVKGLSRGTAEIVAKELTERDAFVAHVRDELNINPDELTNPWHAAYASGFSFISGGIIPLITVMVAPDAYKIIFTFVAVLVALVITGILSAHVGGADKVKATIRVVLGGVFAMVVTYLIGALFGVRI